MRRAEGAGGLPPLCLRHGSEGAVPHTPFPAAHGLGLWQCSQGPGTAASGARAAWAGTDERQIYCLLSV